MKNALMAAALIAAAVLAYGNTLSAPFIYDDRPVIVKNPLIRNIRRIPLLFKTSYWGMQGGPQGGLYRPVTMTTFALNYSFGGLHPAGYHVVNLLLHIGVSFLFWMLCLRFGFSSAAAGAAAFLFALLPVHTEAVSNIVGRSEILSAFFVLLSWILVMGHPRRIEQGLGTLCFILALLSKENAAAFFPLLILSDYVTRQKPWTELAKERLMIWVLYGGSLLLYLEWRFFILGSVTAVGGFPYFTSQNFLTVTLSMARFIVRHYLEPLILGAGFCADFTRPSLPDAGIQDLTAWACAVVILAVLCGSLYLTFKRKNRVAFWVFLFFVLLFPVSNLLVPLEVIGAERFLYLPSIAFCAALAIFGEEAIRRKVLRTRLVTILGVGLCLWYGWRTYDRNRIWRSEDLFWKATALAAPQSPRSWNGLGLTLLNEKKYDEAIHLFGKAVALNPLLLDAHYNMALCFFLKGDYHIARKGFQYVARFKPDDPDTLYHLARSSEYEGKETKRRADEVQP